MKATVYGTTAEMAQAAAEKAARELSSNIAGKGWVTFMAATGQSQFGFLEALSRHGEVDWSKTTMYHLDEYIGLPESHPASFRRYLQERLIGRVHPGTVQLINGDAPDARAECDRLNALLAAEGVDVAFVGIGENAHLAFNDPPADFENDDLFTVVELSDSCRSQQVHEGWFETVSEVPRKAITITINGLLKSRCIVCTAPEARKAAAVKCALTGPVAASCPASVLRRHPDAHLYLDKDAARLLDAEWVREHRAAG